MASSDLGNFQQAFRDKCLSSYRLYPYEWQSNVGGFILQQNHHSKECKYLCVRPTGGGKTLLFKCIASCLCGVTICIDPLLSLAADQSRKVLESTRDKSITAFHLDEMDEPLLQALYQGLQQLQPTQTVILFASPQKLVNDSNVTDIFNLLLQKDLLRFIVVDEIHLSIHFGRSES